MSEAVIGRKRLSDRPLKVLIYQEAWGRGGVENFVMGLLRNLDPQEYDVELMSAYDWHNGCDQEIKELGYRRSVVFSGTTPSHIKRFVRGTQAWRRRLSRGDVDIVHVNVMNGITLAYAAIAKKKGVPVRVVHSHNTSFSGGMRLAKAAIHSAARAIWGGAATTRLACSDAAGSYMFGNRDFRFVPNGIDVERFRFNPITRKRMRKELGIEQGTVVCGSLGRLSYQKNPLFAVNILEELVRRGEDVKLLLVGDGELEVDVMRRVVELGLEDRYLHLSSVTNAEAYYCVLDVFLLPSVFEGFPFALLEAQCCGLPAIVSEAIQDEVCVTGLVKRIELGAGTAAWCDLLLGDSAEQRNRRVYADEIAAAGYSVSACVEVVLDAWG